MVQRSFVPPVATIVFYIVAGGVARDLAQLRIREHYRQGPGEHLSHLCLAVVSNMVKAEEFSDMTSEAFSVTATLSPSGEGSLEWHWPCCQSSICCLKVSKCWQNRSSASTI